jgi:enoyl-ACP reductase-like protein
MEIPISTSLAGKRGLVVGIANEASIAAGCASAFAAAGATLAATYLNDKAQPYVRAVTDPLGCKLLLVCDVRVLGNSKQRSSGSAPNGVNWISCCTRLPTHPRTICTAAWWTAAPKGSLSPWTCPVTPSCAWRISPSR